MSLALQGSYLTAAIQVGLQAVPSDKRRHIAEAVRADFADSLDLDKATKPQHPTDARWDFLLGHAPTSHVIAVETHPAETSQVSQVIQKRSASLRHLREELRRDHHVAAWYWAASGRVDFVPHEKAMLRLTENGIEFVGGRLEAKHLAKLPTRSTARVHRARRQRSRT